jgi:hypothetical protein
MPDIDRQKFAYVVAGRLLTLGRAEGRDGPLPLRNVQHRFPWVSAGSMSRIANGIDVSAAVMLGVCRALELDPFDFLDIDAPSPKSSFGKSHADRKSLSKQYVSVGASRETGEAA